MYQPQTYASRNIRLCTKDCLCLFVCPTGATDTENGQVDASKCISGCRLCVDTCPSHALSLMYKDYPPQQEKADAVVERLFELAKTKVEQEAIAKQVAETTENESEKRLAKALEMSFRVQAEDLYREARFMLPQSAEAKGLLQSMLEDSDEGFPREVVEDLLANL